jgi:Ni,Fe-hydrogenase I cytochrome b subunit
MGGCLLLFIIYLLTATALTAAFEFIGVIGETGNAGVSIFVLIASWFISMFIMKVIYKAFSPEFRHDDIDNGRMF